MSLPRLDTHTFVGRERELAEIETLLTSATNVHLRAALDGLPGIGKTEPLHPGDLRALRATRRRASSGSTTLRSPHDRRHARQGRGCADVDPMCAR